VYIIGFSAGGDGVYRLASRLADRWASASMMAGHPGLPSDGNRAEAYNLINLPFGVFVGENDNAYDRNKSALAWKQRLEDLQLKEVSLYNEDMAMSMLSFVPYEHRVKLYDNKGHWMDNEEKENLRWMSACLRNPWPKKIVWQQDDVFNHRFYWLQLPKKYDNTSDRKRKKPISVTVVGPKICVRCPYDRINILLSDKLINLDSQITLIFNGKQKFSGVIPRSTEVIERSLKDRLDKQSCPMAIASIGNDSRVIINGYTVVDCMGVDNMEEDVENDPLTVESLRIKLAAAMRKNNKKIAFFKSVKKSTTVEEAQVNCQNKI
jgi:hypothetical protein